MKKVVAFFKDIFMISDETSKLKIGLSQFKEEKEIKKVAKKVNTVKKEVKLSDLIRKSA